MERHLQSAVGKIDVSLGNLFQGANNWGHLPLGILENSVTFKIAKTGDDNNAIVCLMLYYRHRGRNHRRYLTPLLHSSYAVKISFEY